MKGESLDFPFKFDEQPKTAGENKMTVDDYLALEDITSSADGKYRAINPDYYIPSLNSFYFERNMKGFKDWLAALRSKKIVSMRDSLALEVLFRENKISFRGKFYSDVG
jgi:hypothetical protein